MRTKSTRTCTTSRFFVTEGWNLWCQCYLLHHLYFMYSFLFQKYTRACAVLEEYKSNLKCCCFHTSSPPLWLSWLRRHVCYPVFKAAKHSFKPSLFSNPARLVDGNASENIVVLYVCFLITESNRCQLQNWDRSQQNVRLPYKIWKLFCLFVSIVDIFKMLYQKWNGSKICSRHDMLQYTEKISLFLPFWSTQCVTSTHTASALAFVYLVWTNTAVDDRGW